MTALPDPAIPPPAPKTWADVASIALHYAAAGCLLGAIGFFTYTGKVDAGTFTALCVAALAGLGVYQGTRP